MRKKFLIILTLIVVILGLTIFVLKEKEKLLFTKLIKNPLIEESKIDEEFEKCNSLNSNLEKDLCFQNLAIKKENEKYCEKINDENIKESCYFSLANISGKENIKLCDKIKNEDQRLFCQVKISLDKSYCEKVKDKNQKISCFSYLAFIFSDEKMCDDIKEDEDKKNLCLALSNLNQEFCEKISKISDKNDCYYIMANLLKNEKICEKISKEENIQICKKHIEKGFYEDLIKKRNENKK